MENDILEKQEKRIFAENEDELLNEAIKCTQMGIQSLDVVEKFAEGELQCYVKQLMGEYAAISKKVSDYLCKLDIEPRIFGSMKQTWQRGMVKMSVMADDSNSHIAEKLIKGTNLAVTSLTRSLNANRQNVSDSSVTVVEELLVMLSGSVDALKKFL